MIILMYHGIVPDEETDPVLIDGRTKRTAFHWQMRWLKRHAKVLPLGDAVDMLRSGGTLPPRATVLTFDDGLRNNAEVALPVLQEFRLPATFFVATAHLEPGRLLWFSRLAAETFATGRNGDSSANRLKRVADLRRHYQAGEPAESVVLERGERVPASLPAQRLFGTLAGMTREQVRQAARSGLVEVGSHSLTHPLLTRCMPDRLWREVSESRKELEVITGKPVRFFAYPGGDYDTRVTEHVKQAGYAAAVAVDPVPGQVVDYAYSLPRVGIYGDSKVRFMAKWLGLQGAMRAAYRATLRLRTGARA